MYWHMYWPLRDPIPHGCRLAEAKANRLQTVSGRLIHLDALSSLSFRGFIRLP